MKIFSGQTKRQRSYISFLFFTVLLLFFSSNVKGNFFVKGKVVDEKNKMSVPYAYVSVVKDSATENNSMKRTMCNEDGIFRINLEDTGRYRLFINAIGYKSASFYINISEKKSVDAGEIYLKDSVFVLSEMTVTEKRSVGKGEGTKTIYFTNKPMLEASATGIDVLRFIPGVQIDLRQNIFLEGSNNIQIFVDGIERDKNFLSQLNPEQIDKIEVLNSPHSGLDGDVTGAICIVLKKNSETGLNGRLFAELPTNIEEIYLFPTYNLNYSFRKINLFTSYDGEINYENLDESVSSFIWDSNDTSKFVKNQYVRQKNLSNKFHYGFDYYLSSDDQLNFYGFFNPYSSEQNGNVIAQISGTAGNSWNAVQKESDHNVAVLNSLFYKHIFHKSGGVFSIDMSNFNLNADNMTCFYQDEKDLQNKSYKNIRKPEESSNSIRADFETHFEKSLNISAGVKAKLDMMKDKSCGDFDYRQNVYAIYGMANYSKSVYEFKAGLRLEDAMSEVVNTFKKSFFTVLPHFTVNYKINKNQKLMVACNRSVNRPTIHQLNPYIYVESPFSLNRGNTFLKPEIHESFYIEHSARLNNSFSSVRLFHKNTKRTIGNLTYVNDTSAFETMKYNLGKINETGLQFSGSIRMGSVVVNPWISLCYMTTTGNSMATIHGTKNKSDIVFESGVSSVAALKHDFTISLIFQYSTPKSNIQEVTFCDPLYFISLDKTFRKRFKAGFVSALPFTRSFIYQGSEIEGENFYSRYQGILKLSAFPLNLRLSYQFQYGKNKDRIEREKEEVVARPKRGF